MTQEFVPAQKKPGKKLPMIKVPDLFKNVKIKKSNYLKYNRVNLDKFGPPVTEGTIIPNHYVKYIDPSNSESQNTEELLTCWHHNCDRGISFCNAISKTLSLCYNCAATV